MDYIFKLITKAVTTAAKLSIALNTYKAPPRPTVKPQNTNARQPINRTAPTAQAAPAAPTQPASSISQTPPPVKTPEPQPESEYVYKRYRGEFEGAAPIAPGDIYVPDIYRSQRNEIRVIELTCESARALGYLFHRKSKSVRITGYHGTDTEIILPSKIGGLPVNEIGRHAFADSDIESVEIPDSIRKIGAEAFFESGVKRVIFGEGVRDIPERAFYKCAKLRTAALPTTLRSIGREAFYGCTELSYISLPYSLTSIGEKCFAQSDLRGFAAAFYSNFPHDGTAFEETPLHSNFKVVLAKQNSIQMNVILVGKNARIIFPNMPVLLGKNAACAVCALDFSQCPNVKMYNAFAPTPNIYNYIYHIILPYGIKGLALPGYVGAEYSDGSLYDGDFDIIEKSDDKLIVKVNSRQLPFRSLDMCKKEVTVKVFNVKIEKHAFRSFFNSVEKLEIDGSFTADDMIFCRDYSLSLSRLREVSWTVGRDKKVVQYMPPWWLVGHHAQSELLKAFSGSEKNGLFKREIVDKIFRNGFDYRDALYGTVHERLSQRAKIFLALDVLRSSPELYDNDTSMYLTYIRNRRRYAEKVCENIKDDHPEYLELLLKLSV